MRVLALVVVAMACAVGCGGKGKPVPTPTSTAAPAAVSVGPPVTAEEAEDFADDLEAAIAAGDAAEATKLLHIRELVERSTAGLGFSADFTAGVRQGAMADVSKFSQAVIDQTKDGGRYERVTIRTRDGRPSVVFRLIGTEGAVNYHELPLVRFADGVGSSDVHIAVTGEPLSATFRRLVGRAGAEANAGLLARLSGAEQLYLKNLSTITAMNEHVLAGRYAQGLTAYRSLPAALRTDKSLLLVGLTAAGGVNDGEYLRLMELYRTTYPDDPALDLMAVDYHFVRKEYAESVVALDRLDKQVGGDPYLDTLRANAFALAGKPAEATAAAERLVAWRSHEAWGYQAGLTAGVAAKDHPATAKWFRRGVEAGALLADVGFVRESDDYAAFRHSPQFAELEKWVADRAKKADKADPDG